MEHRLASYIWFARNNPVLAPRRRSVRKAQRWIEAARPIADVLVWMSWQDLQQWAATVYLEQGTWITLPPGLDPSRLDGTCRRQANDAGGISGRLLLDLSRWLIGHRNAPVPEDRVYAWSILYPQTASLQTDCWREWEWIGGISHQFARAVPAGWIGREDPEGDWRLASVDSADGCQVSFVPLHDIGGGRISLTAWIDQLQTELSETPAEPVAVGYDSPRRIVCM